MSILNRYPVRGEKRDERGRESERERKERER